MSGGRQWVRRLGLLLAAGLVVQVPGLGGVGVSGASAATGTYQATLSIDSNCVAPLKATWENGSPKPQSLQFSVNDLTTGQTDGPVNESVSGNPGTLSQSFQTHLNLLPISTTDHSFNAIVWFYSGSSSSQIYTKSLDA